MSLSLKNLTNALRKVDDWQGLGIQLEIDYHELQKLAKVHSTIEERKYAVLQLWLDRDTKASWEKLHSALSEMKLNRVADKVKQKYQTHFSTQLENPHPLVPLVTAESVRNDTTTDPPSIPPTNQPCQNLIIQSQSGNTTVDLDLPSTPPNFQSKQIQITQSEIVPITDPPSVPSTDQLEQPVHAITKRARNIQLEIAALEAMYDDLVARAGLSLSKRQALSPEFVIEFRFSVAVLPTSLKYQHKYFLEHHSSQIARATTVEEIFSILNRYCNFLNCSLLAHIITKFGDAELQKQLSTYTTALQAFRSRTKLTDFVRTCTGKQKIVPELVALKTKMGSEWEHCTLEDAEEFRKSLANSSSLADYVFHLEEIATASAMNFEFLQHHHIEEVTIDDMDLEEYKRQHYIYPGRQFNAFSQVDELSEGLVWASREGCLEDVVFLLSIGVEVNSRGQWSGRTALMQASESGCLDVVKELLGAMAGVDMQDEDGITALMRASICGHTDVVQLILSSGAQVDLQDKDGWSALMWGSRSGHTDVVQLLLSSGAQVDLQEMGGRTANIVASRSGHTDVVQLLLSSGAQVDLQTENGSTALMCASGSGHTDLVQLLLSSGAQVNLQDKWGRTAIIRASLFGHTDVVQLLLSSEAQVDLQDEDGMTALIHATRFGNIETVKTLLAAGADVNLQEKTSGRSAMFYGAEDGDLEMVKLLMQGGASLSLKDKDGVTADQVAEVEGNPEVCEELRKHIHGGRKPLSKTVRDRVLATGQLLRALYKRLEERILRTQKKDLVRRTQDPPSTPSGKSVRDPRELRQQEETVPGHGQ